MMEAEQLYVAGREICPKTNYEKDDAVKKMQQMQALLDEITNRVINQLLQEAKEYADSTYMQATGYTDSAIAALINGAPSTRDTLKEIADVMAENEDVVQALEAAIGTRANEIEFQAHAGNETVHVTASEKQKINEIDAIKQSFRDGCSMISNALTSLGIATAENASPEVIAVNIQQMYDARYAAGTNASKVGTALSAQVLTGYTFTNADGVGINGSMPNKGAVSQALNCGGSYTIPSGYHNGSGKVTANSLASQTQATAAAANITKNKTAWVNGAKITGTGADNTTNYNNGYNAGVAAADARVNTASANYKGGYNAGRVQGQNDVKANPAAYGIAAAGSGEFVCTSSGPYDVGTSKARYRVDMALTVNSKTVWNFSENVMYDGAKNLNYHTTF